MASLELRKAWSAMTDFEIKDLISEKGVKVSLLNTQNRHFKISGKVRDVELYATTGTVNAAKHENLKPVTAKEMKPHRAILRAVSIADIGH